MTPEEFKRRYELTHDELHITEALERGVQGGSLIRHSPGDKNISKIGKIPGKDLIEETELDKRRKGLQQVLLDACAAKTPELMDLPADKVFTLAIKALPSEVQQEIDHSFTFADMVKKAKIELEAVETVDAEIRTDS